MDSTAQISAAPQGLAVKAGLVEPDQKFNNKYLEKFLKTADDAEWERAVDFHNAHTRKEEKAGFMAKYKFSWNSIRSIAEKLGKYDRKRAYSPRTSTVDSTRATAPEKEKSKPVADSVKVLSPSPFMVEGATAKDTCHTRSIQLSEDADILLRSIEDDYPQYNHKSIINQIIMDGLAMHGYTRNMV